MKKQISKMVMVLAVLATFSGCTTLNKTMREPNTRVNFSKSDFTLSDQVTADATTTRILGVDWERLFLKQKGIVKTADAAISYADIPVIGNYITCKTAHYSLYNLMNRNPGYDVVFYPQYEIKVYKPVIGIGFILKITTVKTTARLGKLNQ